MAKETMWVYVCYALTCWQLIIVLFRSIRLTLFLGRVQLRVFTLMNKLSLGFAVVFLLIILIILYYLGRHLDLHHLLHPEIILKLPVNYGFFVAGINALLGGLLSIFNEFQDGSLRENGVYIKNKVIYWSEIEEFRQINDTTIILVSDKFGKKKEYEWDLSEQDVPKVMHISRKMLSKLIKRRRLSRDENCPRYSDAAINRRRGTSFQCCGNLG